ncbi:MAG TPA: hypothetical protein DCS09_08625 [Porphyromonadaceae bacterium]|nr:hypothetical protein [Porphyromonadaceae bacterium]
MKKLLVAAAISMLLSTPCLAGDEYGDDGLTNALIAELLTLPEPLPQQQNDPPRNFSGDTIMPQTKCQYRTWTINREHDMLICTQDENCNVTCI